MFRCQSKASVLSRKLSSSFAQLTTWRRIISICAQHANRNKMQQSHCVSIKRQECWSWPWRDLIFLGGKLLEEWSTLAISIWKSIWIVRWITRIKLIKFVMKCMTYMVSASTLAIQPIQATTSAIVKLRKVNGSSVMTRSSRKHLSMKPWAKKLTSCSIRNVLVPPKSRSLYRKRVLRTPHLLKSRNWLLNRSCLGERM